MSCPFRANTKNCCKDTCFIVYERYNRYKIIVYARQNTQKSFYLDLFFQPHICWKAVGRNLAFALVEAGTFLTAPASFISAGIYNKTVLAFLCSTVGTYFVYKNSDTTGAGDIMLNIQSLIKFPIPKLNIDFDNFSDREIDLYIYDIYKFTKEEIHYIEEQV